MLQLYAWDLIEETVDVYDEVETNNAHNGNYTHRCWNYCADRYFHADLTLVFRN